MLMVATIFVLGYFNLLPNSFLTTILLQVIIISGIPILLYSLLISKNLKQTFSDFGFKKLKGKLLILSICLAFVLFFLNIFVADCFSSIIVLLGFENAIPLISVSNSELLTDFFLTACLPGLCEEIIHRGMMLNGCKKHGFTRYGLIFSSILFGLMHLNILQFFYATILGFLIGISVLATESIWTGVIIHFTNNFLSVYFSVDKALPFKNTYNYIFGLFSNINSMAFIIIVSLIIIALLCAFTYIIKLILKIKLQTKAEMISKELNFENLTETEAELKVEEINRLLSNVKTLNIDKIKDNNKSSFTDKIFLYSSLCLGAIATLFSFIAGIL